MNQRGRERERETEKKKGKQKPKNRRSGDSPFSYRMPERDENLPRKELFQIPLGGSRNGW